MQTQHLNNRTLKLFLTAVALVALAAVACNGDDSSPAGGSPSPDASPNPAFTPVITPGSGLTAAQAVGTYIDANGLDGHQLDWTRQEECPLEEVIGTPGVESRLYMAQFCLTPMNVVPEKTMTIVVDLPDTGETWEMKLEFDADISLWKVKEVDKVSE
jgi:hypothetical protein